MINFLVIFYFCVYLLQVLFYSLGDEQIIKYVVFNNGMLFSCYEMKL